MKALIAICLIALGFFWPPAFALLVFLAFNCGENKC